jgi:hypothetical protein
MEFRNVWITIKLESLLYKKGLNAVLTKLIYLGVGLGQVQWLGVDTGLLITTTKN